MKPKIIFEDIAWQHYVAWEQEDKKTLKRINDLIKDCQREPFKGIGKPEPLHATDGEWSRRIDHENRLIYRVVGDTIVIVNCTGHYTQ